MELKENLKAGDEIRIQIAPFGDYPAMTTEGKEIVQKFNRESFENVIDDWKKSGEKMICADFDHNSEMTDNTIASGWIKELAIDENDGLVGTLVVSESGADALNGLDYRFGSPVFLFDESEHPTTLVSFAFTNRPRLKEMSAVWNSEEKIEVKEETKEETVEEPETPIEEKTVEEIKEETVEEVNINKEEKSMEEIKVVLGLPEEATEEDIINSVKELVEKLKAIADEELEKEADEIINECGIDDEKKDEVRNSYKQNPALVKSVLNCLKMTPSRMVINAEEAEKPSLTYEEKLLKEYHSLKGGEEKVNFLLNHKGMKF